MSRGKRWFRLGILGVAVGVVAGGYTATWLERAELRNEIVLARSEGLPVEPADLRSVRIPDNQNAVPDLFRAWALLHSRFLPEYKRLESSLRGTTLIGLSEPTAQDMADLARLQPVVAVLHRASLKPNVDFHRRWEDGPDAQFDFADIRTCVKLLLADARRQDRIGRPEAATGEWVDAARLSGLISHEPDLAAAYTSLGCSVMLENEIESWMWDSKLKPGISRRVRAAIDALGRVPDVRHALSGQLVLMREGIRALARANMRTLVFQSARMHSLRFSHVQEVREAYDIRVIQAWRALYSSLPSDDSDLPSVNRALAAWTNRFDWRRDWTYDYLRAMVYGISNFGIALDTQLARRRVLITLADLLELKANGKTFDGKLSPENAHIDPCTGGLLHVAPKPGGWLVYSLGPDQMDWGGARNQAEFANIRQNIVAEYPKPTAKPPTGKRKPVSLVSPMRTLPLYRAN